LLSRHLTSAARGLHLALTALFLVNLLLGLAVLLAPALPLLAAARLAVLLIVALGCLIPATFWQQSRAFSGATRQQMRCISLGAALLLANLLLLAWGDLVPISTAGLALATSLLFVLLGLALWLGFAPPRWVWQLWQHKELARLSRFFDDQLLAGNPPAARAQMLERLLEQALGSLRCQAAVIEGWNEATDTFEVLAEASAAVLPSPSERLLLKQAQLREVCCQRRVIIAPLDPEQRALRWLARPAGMLLAVPIGAPGQPMGVLGIASTQAPLFPQHHLALLHVVARQVALWLLYAPLTPATPERPLVKPHEEPLPSENKPYDKEAFIALMAHELRSPLTVIKGRRQLLKRQLARDGLHSVLEAMNRLDPQFQRLEQLINALVDVSYLDAGRFLLHQQPLDLAALLEELVEQQQRLRPSHALLLETRCPEPAWVQGDATRLRQVLQALLGRARSVSPAESAISIIIEQTINNEEITIVVQDCGDGIAPEQQAQVFQRCLNKFIEPGGQPRTELELYISHEIILQHGGRMWVESSGLPGEGSTFAFALPLLDAEEQQHLPTSSISWQAAGPHPRLHPGQTALE
jgi:signal transduction histidine kinase